jgi:predicted amidohydrolase
MNFKISLAQMHIQPGKVEMNRQRAVEMIAEAAARGSSLVLLPELWSSGYDLENGDRHAAETPQILKELQTLARSSNLHIAGSLLEKTPSGLRNTCSWLSSGADAPLSYSKIHLFRLMQEDTWLSGGDHLQQVPAPWGNTGLAICYDLRFPELFRHYALDGSRAFALCAEWPIRRINHWQTLLRARAIENQAFVFAVNCVGTSGSETFGGRSAVITPWGEVSIEGSQSEEDLLTVEINPTQVEEARSFLPVFQDRRPDLYLPV